MWTLSTGKTIHRLAVAAIASMGALTVSQVASAQETSRFDSPEAAVKALMDASGAKNKQALRQLFGPLSDEMLSGDAVADQADLASFAERLQKKHALHANDDGTRTVLVGVTAHPFAIPLTEADGKWFFDTEAGKDELLNRRIGTNELNAIAVCRTYVFAQREYFDADRDGDQVLEYAQKLGSTPGQQDGLFWETKDGEPLSPLGALVAEARAEGYGKSGEGDRSGPQPYHGYLYKVLTSQGGASPGGKFDYVINGNMVAGFALVAYPVNYGNSGIMTFLVNANGEVIQKDLGESTADVAAQMAAYERDDSWTLVTD